MNKDKKPDEIYCPECGKIIKKNTVICPYCKAQVKELTIEKDKDDRLRCPKCGSTQLASGTKGYSIGKGVTGGVLLGPVGLLGGLIGHKKVTVTCLNCGYKWYAGRRLV